jgi:hypothetical protein
MNALKVKLYYQLSFEFGLQSFERKDANKT